MSILHEEWPSSIPPSKTPPPGSVGIVVPVKDGTKFLKLCVHSVMSFTDFPYALTLVDNFSGWDARKALHSLKKFYDLSVVNYNEDYNFAAEVNLGLAQVFSSPNVQYGLILNADTVVTPFWLSRLMQVLENNPMVGIVGPMSNMAIPEQCDPERKDMLTPAMRVSGFCMLFRRSVWEKLNGFDESFTGGGFEDWDFCERAMRAGFQIAIDGTVHIHHFYRMFRRSNHDDAMKANEKRFFGKHPLIKKLIDTGDLARSSTSKGE